MKVGAGFGGYGINADYRKKLEDEFSTVFDEFKLYSDAYAAMLGALAGEDEYSYDCRYRKHCSGEEVMRPSGVEDSATDTVMREVPTT